MIRDKTFNDLKTQLTKDDIDQLMKLLGKRLKYRNKNLLRKRLESHTSMIPNFGILNRLIKESYGWCYCAGQSYPDEIRTVRNIILNLR